MLLFGTLNRSVVMSDAEYPACAAGKVAATDGRPRKGQDPSDVDAPGLEMEMTGGALKGQQQKGQLKSPLGTAVHLPGSAVDEDARQVLNPLISTQRSGFCIEVVQGCSYAGCLGCSCVLEAPEA